MDRSGDSTAQTIEYHVPWSGFGHGTSVSGAIAISAGWVLSWIDEPSLWLWDAESKSLRELVGLANDVWGMREPADGGFLSWSKDNTLRLWNSSGEQIATLAGHTGPIAGVRELSDGKIISWGDNGNVRLWSPGGRMRRVLGELRDGADPNTDVAFDVSLLCFTDGCVSAGCSCTPETSCSWDTNPATGRAVVRWYRAAGAHSRAAEAILTHNTGLVCAVVRKIRELQILKALPRPVLRRIQDVYGTTDAVYDAAQGGISRRYDDPSIRIQRAGGER